MRKISEAVLTFPGSERKHEINNQRMPIRLYCSKGGGYLACVPYPAYHQELGLSPCAFFTSMGMQLRSWVLLGKPHLNLLNKGLEITSGLPPSVRDIHDTSGLICE